jgi:hypothetical protein
MRNVHIGMPNALLYSILAHLPRASSGVGAATATAASARPTKSDWKIMAKVNGKSKVIGHRAAVTAAVTATAMDKHHEE